MKAESSLKRSHSGACCADGLCSNRTGRNKTSRLPGRRFLRYFRFPKDPMLRRRWSERLSRDIRYFTASDESRICSDHFADEDMDPASIRRFSLNPKSYIKLLPDSLPNTDRKTGAFKRHCSHEQDRKRRKKPLLVTGNLALQSSSMSGQRPDESIIEPADCRPVATSVCSILANGNNNHASEEFSQDVNVNHLKVYPAFGNIFHLIYPQLSLNILRFTTS